MTDVRLSRHAVEALVQVDPDVRLSRYAVEALVQVDPDVRLSRFGVEALIQEVEADFDPANLQVSVTGSTASLTWDASPSSPDDYVVFRRTPQTGDPFDPQVDTPVGSTSDLFFDDEDLPEGDYDWQVFGRSSTS
jgi:hypothetical protein